MYELMHKLSIVIFIFTAMILLSLSCKKPKIGTYILTVEGEENYVQTNYNISTNPVTSTVTSGTAPYTYTTELHLKYSGTHSLDFDGMQWKKDGTAIRYDNTYDYAVGLGAHNSGTEKYEGQIISSNLTSGTAYLTQQFYFCCSNFRSSTVTATFKIEKK